MCVSVNTSHNDQVLYIADQQFSLIPLPRQYTWPYSYCSLSYKMFSCRVWPAVDHPVFWVTANHTEKITGFCSVQFSNYRISSVLELSNLFSSVFELSNLFRSVLELSNLFSSRTIEFVQFSSRTIEYVQFSSRTIEFVQVSTRTIEFVQFSSRTIEFVQFSSRTIEFVQFSSRTTELRLTQR